MKYSNLMYQAHILHLVEPRNWTRSFHSSSGAPRPLDAKRCRHVRKFSYSATGKHPSSQPLTRSRSGTTIKKKNLRISSDVIYTYSEGVTYNASTIDEKKICAGFSWWTLPDSDRSPLPCHGSALPNELKALASRTLPQKVASVKVESG
jgi:hypothetical protein